MLIKINQVNKIYQAGDVYVPALNNISLDIESGEFVAIMGPSGSGKTTLMNILGCLDQPSAGQYFLEGVEINRLSRNELARIRNKKIGFVFQTFNLLPRTSALANVELPLFYGNNLTARQKKQRAEELLKKIGLADRVHHKPNQLSGGEQQRVAVARALVNSPSILLADEPTGNLDSRAGKEIMSLFQQLNSEGVTVILITHDKEVASYAKRVIHIKDGMII